jgi:hypothetical protein
LGRAKKMPIGDQTDRHCEFEGDRGAKSSVPDPNLLVNPLSGRFTRESS